MENNYKTLLSVISELQDHVDQLKIIRESFEKEIFEALSESFYRRGGCKVCNGKNNIIKVEPINNLDNNNSSFKETYIPRTGEIQFSTYRCSNCTENNLGINKKFLSVKEKEEYLKSIRDPIKNKIEKCSTELEIYYKDLQKIPDGVTVKITAGRYKNRIGTVISKSYTRTKIKPIPRLDKVRVDLGNNKIVDIDYLKITILYDDIYINLRKNKIKK